MDLENLLQLKLLLGVHNNIEGVAKKFTDKIGYVPQKISIDWTLPIRVIDFMSLTNDLNNEQINVALNLTGVEHLKKKCKRSIRWRISKSFNCKSNC